MTRKVVEETVGGESNPFGLYPCGFSSVTNDRRGYIARYGKWLARTEAMNVFLNNGEGMREDV